MKPVKNILFIGFCAALFIVSCGSPNSTPDVLPSIDAFDNQRVTITADAQKAVRNRPIIIITSCLPKMSGKGRISLSMDASGLVSRAIVDMPLQDTLYSPEDNAVELSVPIDFVADKPVHQQWRIWLPDGVPYVFDSVARMDSIYVADSSRVYHVNSEIARKQEKLNTTYTYIALSSQFFLYP